MQAIVGTLKSLLIGGLVFLLPVGIVIVVFGKLLAISRQVAAKVEQALFPGAGSPVLMLLIAILILLAIALAAGVFAQTRTGRTTFSTLEATVLARLPIYTILRQMIADMSGGVDQLSGEREARVVAVQFDDQVQIGFFVDETPGGQVIVYVPGAPSALSGTVTIVEADRVRPTDITPTEVMAGMRRLGAGMAVRMAKERS